MKYGGFKIGDLTIGITHLPYRKRPYMYYQKNGTIYPCATFTSEEKAQAFWQAFGEFVCLMDKE